VPTKRAPDKWESARFISIFLASSFFLLSGIFPARPLAGNANRWATRLKKQKRFFNHNFWLGLSFFRGGFLQVFRSFSLRRVWFSIGVW
jgi:hypothetical protein